MKQQEQAEKQELDHGEPHLNARLVHDLQVSSGCCPQGSVMFQHTHKAF